MLIPFMLQAANPSQVYVTSFATYTEATITLLLTMIAVLAASIQIARVYFLRILRKFTLRLAADVWWLIFVILRDASIFLMVFMGILLFWPGIYQDFPIAVPFQPLAISVFAIALVLLLVKDTDEIPVYNSMLTILVLIGTTMYLTGTVFVTESATQLPVLPPTVSMSAGNIWGFFNQYFNSQNDPAMSIYTFYAGFGILTLCALIAIAYSFRGGIFNRVIEPKPQPVVKETVPPPKAPPGPRAGVQ